MNTQKLYETAKKMELSDEGTQYVLNLIDASVNNGFDRIENTINERFDKIENKIITLNK